MAQQDANRRDQDGEHRPVSPPPQHNPRLNSPRHSAPPSPPRPRYSPPSSPPRPRYSAQATPASPPRPRYSAQPTPASPPRPRYSAQPTPASPPQPRYSSSPSPPRRYSYYAAPPSPPRMQPQKPIRTTYVDANPFSDLVPTAFPKGLDKKVVKAFQAADRDGNGFIDEKELKAALGSCGLSFSSKTIRFIINTFTNTKKRMIGPMEFSSVYTGLLEWKASFQRFDTDRNGQIDSLEMRKALQGLGLDYTISRSVLDSIMFMFDKIGGTNMGIGFESFIECCLTVKGLAKKFKEHDSTGHGEATFTYEKFMIAVLPFVVA